MITIRKAAERGHFNHGWLNTYHTFSFAAYYDPAHVSFRALRVINDDTVAPSGGFSPHGHKDMEIITYIISGALAHRDSMGNERTIRTGEVQAMSAGTGVQHSEFNASDSEPVHLLQIWITPHTKNVPPSYDEWMPEQAKPNAWTLAVSGDGAEGSTHIHQDARMYVGLFDRETALEAPLAAGRYGWLQVAKGTADINGIKLVQGDGASFSAEDRARITAAPGTTLLLFDLA